MMATAVDACAEPRARRRGHPPTETIRVLATLRHFLRTGTLWQSLTATADRASGSTLRRDLEDWAQTSVLRKVYAVLVAMLRGRRDLIVDTCSVRAKRGGDLTGPNPTDRGKRGSTYHLAVTGEGTPIACAVTAANLNDTVLFERLFLMAFAVRAPIRTVFADKGYDAACNRDLGRAFAAAPWIHRRGRRHGSGLGTRRWPVERSHAWILENKRLALRYDRLAFICNLCSRPPVAFWLQGAWLANCENGLSEPV